jgi:hypothetical protein
MKFWYVYFNVRTEATFAPLNFLQTFIKTVTDVWTCEMGTTTVSLPNKTFSDYLWYYRIKWSGEVPIFGQADFGISEEETYAYILESS